MSDIAGFIKSRLRRIYRYVKRVEEVVRVKRAVLIAKRIEESGDPVELFSSFQKNRLIPSSILWKALSYLGDKRNPAYDIISLNKNKIEGEEIKCLVRLRESLSSPSPISTAELDEFIGFYKKRREMLKNESDYRRLLIALIAKKLPSSKAYEAFASAGLIDTITIHQVLKVLHKASIEGASEVFFNLKHQYSQQMTPAALVKTMYWESRVSNKSSVNYRCIENNFCQLEKALSKEYKKHLLMLFDAIPEEKNMLDFQIEESKFYKIKENIEEAIKLRKGFSFVRLNDGEGYGFPNTLPCVFDIERQELHWWGEVLDPALRKKIQEDFKRSLYQHDLVGIPSVFRLIDELSINRDYSISNNDLLCRLFTLCHGFLKSYNGEACITEGQINLHLFDKKYIVSLSNLAQRVVFISGAKSEYLQPVFEDVQNVSFIELPTHRLLKAEKFSYSEATQPLPYVYENYLEQIRKLAGPGVVFFISAGFIGKIFAAEVAKNGGVALDVGQTLMSIVASHADA